VVSKRRIKGKSTAVDHGGKNFLTEAEMKRFLDAARHSRHGVRDHAMMLMAFRHGLRVSELVDMRLKDMDLETARLYVRRKKGSLSTHQPIEGDELRALRAWLRLREMRADARSPYLFLSERGPMTRQAFNYLVAQTGKRAKLRFHVHPHMLRHSTGYYLANRNHDTRLIQDYLGHKNIAHTVRYTRTAASRFEGLWR
jgi:site-specific recombinase XerD